MSRRTPLEAHNHKLVITKQGGDFPWMVKLPKGRACEWWVNQLPSIYRPVVCFATYQAARRFAVDRLNPDSPRSKAAFRRDTELYPLIRGAFG